MPSKSKNQQRLFGMVHAFQKGEMQHAPKKIKEVAEHISATDAKHFAATKTKDLPEHVKKEAHDIGFFKAAMSTGMSPLEAVYILKQATMDLSGIDPRLLGALGGGAIGAGTGALLGGEKNRGTGAVTGGLAGALSGGALGSTDMFKDYLTKNFNPGAMAHVDQNSSDAVNALTGGKSQVSQLLHQTPPPFAGLPSPTNLPDNGVARSVDQAFKQNISNQNSSDAVNALTGGNSQTTQLMKYLQQQHAKDMSNQNSSDAVNALTGGNSQTAQLLKQLTQQSQPKAPFARLPSPTNLPDNGVARSVDQAFKQKEQVLRDNKYANNIIHQRENLNNQPGAVKSIYNNYIAGSLDPRLAQQIAAEKAKQLGTSAANTYKDIGDAGYNTLSDMVGGPGMPTELQIPGQRK